MIKSALSKSSPTKVEPVRMQKMNSVKQPEKCSPCACLAPTKKIESKSSPTKTVVRVTFDCGFPNTIHIRGEGCASLSWNKGIPMKNVSTNEWIWECPRPFTKLTFKILINDEVYETGENHTISHGDELTIHPTF